MNRSPQVTPAGQEHLELAERALEGEQAACEAVLEMLHSPDLAAALRSRGASPTEAEDMVSDLIGDCFGGERAKGGLHRLLRRYNGACPLPGFFRHVAINRLISLKRKQAARPEVHRESNEEEDPLDRVASPPAGATATDESLIPLLHEAVVRAFLSVDPEKLVMFRLVHSYRVPQKRVAAAWGWHESKISRSLDALRGELKDAILAEIRRSEPWLQLEWEDFLSLCGTSVDLFGD